MIDSSDYDILKTALTWLEDDHRVILVTVLRTWGSSPRPVGSMMTIRHDGLHTGSVSGGCVEEDLLRQAKQNMFFDSSSSADSYSTANSSPTIIDYGSNSQEASRLGLPCGGRLELLIEPSVNRHQLELLLQKISSGQLVSRQVCLKTGEISLHPASADETFSYQDNTIKKIFGPAWHMLLIGAGHLSQCVAQIALMLDYKVSVCDPREDYQKSWPLEEISISSSMPDDMVKQVANNPRSIVLALTHDPKLDDLALMEALIGNCFYVGALGSKRNNDNRRQRLSQLGLSPQQIKRLHGPVGMDIGSHTPAEIAVAIMAHITSERNVSRRSQNSVSAA